MTVLITLTIAGSDTNNFNLYSDVDGFISSFDTEIDKTSLLAGYSTSLVPDSTTIIRVMSNTDECTNYVDIPITSTTTSTTTTAAP